MKKGYMGGNKISRRWYWMPAAILILGILSIALLVGENRIRERHKNNYEFIHALHEARVRTALFHLWFEEAVSNGTRADIEASFNYLDVATNISAALVYGGGAKGVSAMQPLADPELRAHAESMRTLFAEFRKSAL